MRRTPLRPGAPPKRETPMPPRTVRLKDGPPPTRKTKIKARGKRGHRFWKLVDEGLRAYVRAQGCLACGRAAPSEACHVKSRGAGGGDRNNLWPGCRRCHDAQHREGITSFQRARRLDLETAALRLTARYEREAA